MPRVGFAPRLHYCWHFSYLPTVCSRMADCLQGRYRGEVGGGGEGGGREGSAAFPSVRPIYSSGAGRQERRARGCFRLRDLVHGGKLMHGMNER